MLCIIEQIELQMVYVGHISPVSSFMLLMNIYNYIFDMYNVHTYVYGIKVQS